MFSGVCTNFSSFHHFNSNLAQCSHFQVEVSQLSDFSKFHFEVETLKKTLHKNGYLTKFVDKCIAKFVNGLFVQKPAFITIPKLELCKVLPYLGNIFSITKKRLSRCIGKRLKFCKLKIISETRNRLNNYFRFKDHAPETLQSNFVYRFQKLHSFLLR